MVSRSMCGPRVSSHLSASCASPTGFRGFKSGVVPSLSGMTTDGPKVLEGEEGDPGVSWFPVTAVIQFSLGTVGSDVEHKVTTAFHRRFRLRKELAVGRGKGVWVWGCRVGVFCVLPVLDLFRF